MLFCSILAETAVAAEAFDVFFLAVGSSSYIRPREAGVNGLSDIRGAAKSAKVLANLLDQGGSTFGVTLVSDDRHFVSREDFDAAWARVWEEFSKLKPERPLFVFYFAGHGAADGLTWHELLLMGNFAYRGDLQKLIESLPSDIEKSAVHATGVVSGLTRVNVPFLVLLDTCYEGTPQAFRADALPPAGCPPDDISGFCANLKKRVEPLRELQADVQRMAEGFNQLAASFREMNRFEKTYPVIFSIEPGKIVLTVPDPLNPQDTPVAPLARRAMLILSPAIKNRQPVSLETFRAQMVSPTLDRVSSPGVTYSPAPPNAQRLLISPVPHRGRVESRIGTATTPVICCN